MTHYPNLDGALGYATAILDGTIPANRYVRLAAQRFVDDIEAADSGTSQWEFRRDLAERPMVFAALLPHVKGPKAGQCIALMAWQQMMYANIFGFVERGTSVRRYRQAVVYVPRGNSKTTGVAPIALYCSFLEGEGGAEGYAAAVTRDQSRILWDSAKMMVEKSPKLQKRWGIRIGAHALYQPGTGSKFVAISSDAKALDGLSVSVAILDEIASHRTSHVYDVLLTAMGKRLNPLLITISTATGNNSGIGRQLWDYAVRVLEGTHTDDRLYALIYCADPEDDPWDERTWIKVNPAWGEAVQPDAIRSIMHQARSNPAQEAAAKTRHLNIWVGADNALFSTAHFMACADKSLRIEDFEGRECHLGIDLANKTDLASVAIVFPGQRDDGAQTYTVFTRNFLNEDAVANARNASYPGWAKSGALSVTSGNETDYAVIEEHILDLCHRFAVKSAAFDEWSATQLAQRLTAEGVPMMALRPTVANLSEPTKEFGAAMIGKRLTHNGDPILTWCVGNTEGRYDTRGNVTPNKPKDVTKKIDAAYATITAIARCMAVQDVHVSYYENNPLLFV